MFLLKCMWICAHKCMCDCVKMSVWERVKVCFVSVCVYVCDERLHILLVWFRLPIYWIQFLKHYLQNVVFIYVYICVYMCKSKRILFLGTVVFLYIFVSHTTVVNWRQFKPRAWCMFSKLSDCREHGYRHWSVWYSLHFSWLTPFLWETLEIKILRPVIAIRNGTLFIGDNLLWASASNQNSCCRIFALQQVLQGWFDVQESRH